MIDEYIRRYGRRLYGLCRSLCPSPFDADDLYQETWLRVVKHIDQYDLSREFEPWLTRICVNTYRSTLRRLTRSPVLDFTSGEEKERLLQSIPAPEEKDYGALYEAVGKLPDKLRLAVVLFYFQGEDLASTAEILNIPVGTVKSRLNKARKLLKEVLTDETTCDFDRFDPPVLNENMLRRELERRTQRRQTVLLAIAGALLELAVVLLAVLMRDWNPVLSLSCICSAILSTAAGAVIAILYTMRGGEEQLNEQHEL